MHKLFYAMMPWLFAAIGYKATAQEVTEVIVEGKPLPQAKTREITIRKKGDKNISISIEFKDDKLLINGKPLAEFKDDEISINNRSIIINGKGNMAVLALEKQFKELDLQMPDVERIDVESMFSSKSFLGVTTQKDEKGAMVVEVSQESAAKKAGLKQGDIITEINTISIDGPEKLAETIGKLTPNTEIKIGYKRDGKNKSCKATLQERKENSLRNFSFTMPGGNVKSLMLPGKPIGPPMPGTSFNWDDGEKRIFIQRSFEDGPKLGLKIQDLEEGSGVRVLEVEAETTAAKAGLQKDDIITAIAGVKVDNTDDAREQLMINGQKNTYSISAKRNNADITFDIKIPKKLKTINL